MPTGARVLLEDVSDRTIALGADPLGSSGKRLVEIRDPRRIESGRQKRGMLK
jgi:hypothetical protein